MTNRKIFPVPKADSEENALIVIRPSNAPSIFEKLYRSNFSIIGLRTVRLSRKSAKTIFNVSKGNGYEKYTLPTPITRIYYM